MKKSLLQSVYDPEDFRSKGHQLIDLLADHLGNTTQEKSEKVLHWNLPEKELKFWQEFLVNGDEANFFQNILAHTTHIHHPRYIGHQASPTAPITVLTNLISGLLNNGMAVYEMGMAPNAIERIITDLLCKRMGYTQNANGFLTSGGTLGNLTALLAARRAVASEDIWKNGSTKPLGIMVSEQAHYCVDRAAKIMGLGEKGVIKIPVNEDYTMNTALLETYYKDAQEAGIEIFAIVGSAPCTATGMHDNLEEIAHFAKQKKIWFHADAAHGGAAIFSNKYKHLLQGIQHADSIVLDGHKMLMMPMITTALLFKNGQQSYETFMLHADYLLAASKEQEWYNSGRRTFECTKYMMCLHWYVLLKNYGEEVFETSIDTLYNITQDFNTTLAADPDFEVAVVPESNIVCFRYIGMALDTTATNQLNAQIRQQILEEGTFYIVQTTLRDKYYLRTTIMNPFTTLTHLKILLKNVKAKAKTLTL